jgi:hypothetical protein
MNDKRKMLLQEYDVLTKELKVDEIRGFDLTKEKDLILVVQHLKEIKNDILEKPEMEFQSRIGANWSISQQLC